MCLLDGMTAIASAIRLQEFNTINKVKISNRVRASFFALRGFSRGCTPRNRLDMHRGIRRTIGM